MPWEEETLHVQSLHALLGMRAVRSGDMDALPGCHAPVSPFLI